MKGAIRNIGIDLVDVVRFRDMRQRRGAFLKKVFSEQERTYCFSYKEYAPHLAGIFAAKEAAVKALGADTVLPHEIEVRHGGSGQPELWRNGSLVKNARLSISHTRTLAAAVVLLQ